MKKREDVKKLSFKLGRQNPLRVQAYNKRSLTDVSHVQRETHHRFCHRLSDDRDRKLALHYLYASISIKDMTDTKSRTSQLLLFIADVKCGIIFLLFDNLVVQSGVHKWLANQTVKSLSHKIKLDFSFSVATFSGLCW